MVRISDARMSGTAFGTVVLHVAPEAAVGGPLAAVADGDPIVLDVDGGRLDLDVPARRARGAPRAGACPPEPAYRAATARSSSSTSLQADQGCDFDFLRATPGAEPNGSRSGSCRAGSAAGDGSR